MNCPSLTMIVVVSLIVVNYFIEIIISYYFQLFIGRLLRLFELLLFLFDLHFKNFICISSKNSLDDFGSLLFLFLLF
jgi:hypothetical protein